MKRDFVINGVHIGEHLRITDNADEVVDEIQERCIKPGHNFLMIRAHCGTANLSQETYIEWARYLTEKKVYFMFLYSTNQFDYFTEVYSSEPEERDNIIDNYPLKSIFEPATVKKIKEIAGEYFIGDQIGETGGHLACKWPGYFNEGTEKVGKFCEFQDMKEAHSVYIRCMKRLTDFDKQLGMPEVMLDDPTFLVKYNEESGITLPSTELLNGRADLMIPMIRGTMHTMGASLWAVYIAHEWFGGRRHDDMLKRKRLDLLYKFAYLSGANIFCLESGDDKLNSYGYSFEKDSEICKDYRKILEYTTNLIKQDARPKGGPKVKLAFVSGLHDGYGGWGGSSVWNQFNREEWGHNEAEHSWRIAEEIGTKRTWDDIDNYGDEDLSAYPAYGTYDIVGIEADIEKLAKYDYLIMLGWNSMTDENMDKLTEYVRRGGRLLLSAAHLNSAIKRYGDFEFPSNEKMEKLFGARFTGDLYRSNNGLKFISDSIDGKMLYPKTKEYSISDPLFSAGYVDYAKLELCGAKLIGAADDCFQDAGRITEQVPIVIENKVGDGVVTLVTSVNYPGHPAVYKLYRAMVREFVSASARNCAIKVVGSDRLRYSVYDGDKIYLLNTDYDAPIVVEIIHGEKKTRVILESLELKTIQL